MSAEHLSFLPWAEPVERVLAGLAVRPEEGLDAAEVRARRRRYGANRLREAHRESAWAILLRQFRSLIVLLLVAAAGVAFVSGQWREGVAIAIVVAVNAGLGFVMELRAVRSMEALRLLANVRAKVRRGGRLCEVPSEALVPGDVVALEGGDLIAADLRVIEASKLQADESALTGESAPVGKRSDPLPAETGLAERRNMLFKGTALTRGAGEGVVVATGMSTELGKIAGMVAKAEKERTPLEKRLDQLGGNLVWVTLGITVLITASGALAGKNLILMIETGIALAVATVPEGLPIVATIALARGMWRMASRNALVNRLSAVETLGATSVICTDKTGTLTENRMTVVRLDLPTGRIDWSAEDGFRRDGSPIEPKSDPVFLQALETGVLCNNAELGQGGEGRAVGDPMEVALLEAGERAGIGRRKLLEGSPEEHEEAFDPETRMMATLHAANGGFRIAVKGAPEAVLRVSTHVADGEGDHPLNEEERAKWARGNEEMAEEGLRILALATRSAASATEAPYGNLRFLGLVGLLDPPREDVPAAIESCRDAGIRVIMVTGDQAGTARKVGEILGLLESGEEVVAGTELDTAGNRAPDDVLRRSIFARVSPRQKLELIGLHQKAGSVVAMTGDGVNDAPALRKADIGVAMGLRGTQVAAEAADMVLRDDAFKTIVAAVRHGRIIFDNIRKFVLYLLSCNVSEVLVVGLAALVNAPLPITPLQILFLNLVTDVFPALALGVGEGDPGVMRRPPRPAREPILARRHWLAIGAWGMLITAAVLGALALALAVFGMDERRAVTISFLTLAFAQLWHVFNMRGAGSTVVRNDVVRNPFVWGALGLCAVLLFVGLWVPLLAEVLHVVDPGREGWLLVAGMSLLPLLLGQAARGFGDWPHASPRPVREGDEIAASASRTGDAARRLPGTRLSRDSRARGR